MPDEFDYVIVGGGTAAGILAYRLGEGGHSVCVLEAGPADNRFIMTVPAGFIKTLFDQRVTWQFASTPNPNTMGRAIQYTQGKTLGGSTSVNGMVYNRGQAADFDSWAQAGNRGWGYADILPYFRRTERYDGGVDEFRGAEGRLDTTISPWPSDVVDRFMEAAQHCGHPLNSDYNGRVQEGVGRYQSAICKGRRASTATAFLHPARRAFGVDVRVEAQATRILLEEGRAVGVEYRRHGTVQQVMARREVILSAGTIHSPKLLQLSGIGDPALLASHGIALRHALPGVGRNLRDHYSPRIVARARPGVDTINAHVRGPALAVQIARWLIGRPSVLALSPALVHVFGKSNPALDNPDYSLVFTPGSYKAGFIGRLDDFPGMTCGAWQMRPESSGHVRIRSANPDIAPEIDANYLAEEGDRRVLIAGLRAARAIYRTSPLAEIIDQELFPGDDVQTDDEWLAFARANGNSSYHLVGTSKMGAESDPLAVVNDRLQLHGIDRLRVVDASIMPTMPSANTCASTMMIAEKAADMILGRYAAA